MDRGIPTAFAAFFGNVGLGGIVTHSYVHLPALLCFHVPSTGVDRFAPLHSAAPHLTGFARLPGPLCSRATAG